MRTRGPKIEKGSCSDDVERRTERKDVSDVIVQYRDHDRGISAGTTNGLSTWLVAIDRNTLGLEWNYFIG